MVDTIRGNGIYYAHDALAALSENPERLEHARRRFSQSPPVYRSQPSGTTTRSQSPNPPSEELQRWRDRKDELYREWRATRAYDQFNKEVNEEKSNNRDPFSFHAPYDRATRAVKKRWQDEGLWSESWVDHYNITRWKHEMPLDDSESETDPEAEPPSIFSANGIGGKARRRKKSDEKLRRISERRVERDLQREATRPFHRFIRQLTEERDRIREETGAASQDNSRDPDDINTIAYENIKKKWTDRGIWTRKWGILPGMSWKHERPFDELVAEEIGPEPTPPEANLHKAHYALPKLFQTQVEKLGEVENRIQSGQGLVAEEIGPEPAPPEANLHEAHYAGLVPGTTRYLFQAQVEKLDEVEDGIQSGQGEHHASRVPSPMPQPEGRQQKIRPTTRQRRQQGLKPAPSEDAAHHTLGPVRPARVSKSSVRKAPGPRRGKAVHVQPQDVEPDIPVPSDALATAMPPRRSKRLHTNYEEAPAVVAPSDSRTNGATLARARKTPSSAKPKGVAKRQQPNTKRGRPKKDSS